MLARRDMPPEFKQWNRKWGAPYGGHQTALGLVNLLGPHQRGTILGNARVKRARGPFAFQPNSTTRGYEYPWTYHQLTAGGGSSRILDVGGALSGLQFVLSKEGHRVHNVDPFFDYGSGEYDMDPVAEHTALNRLFGTNVVLHRTTLPEAGLSGPFDAVCCVSTIEHLSPEDIEATLKTACELLAPGGLLVLTVDLFVNLKPFCSRQTNEWGSNASIAWLQELTGFEMAAGDKSELYGYDEFSTDVILSRLEEFDVNTYYPVLAQLVSFRAPG